MSETRLTGLALLNVHRDIPVCTQSLISSQKRRNVIWILLFETWDFAYLSLLWTERTELSNLFFAVTLYLHILVQFVR